MPLVRVTTTAKCSPNLLVGNHTYQPDRQVEQEMGEDDVDLLRALARDGGPLEPMFTAISVVAEPGGPPIGAKAKATPTEPAAEKPAKAPATTTPSKADAK